MDGEVTFGGRREEERLCCGWHGERMNTRNRDSSVPVQT
jgi:hypothetical protein